MNLNQYTKADLIWIIKRLQIRCRYDLDIAVNDLAYEKERERISEAEKFCKLADKKRREYLGILEPYDGKPIADIPIPVLNNAYRVMKEAQNADQKWAKLIGLDINFGASAKDGD